MSISKNNKILSHITSVFDRQAYNYNAASNRLPWSWQRRREASIVSSLIGNITGLHALDLGCGAGFYTRILLSCGAQEVTAVDISPAMVSQLPKERVTGVVGDVETVQFNKQFDIIICAGMLEFTPDPRRVLDNARNQIIDGGFMIVLGPVAGFCGRLYFLYHKLHGLHIHLFDVTNLRDLAESTRWRVNKIIRIFPFTLIMRLDAP